MIYMNQIAYDNASPPELSDYQEEAPFADFAEYVTLELLEGRDWKNLSSEILRVDLECLGGGYQIALELVCDKVTEKQYREWLEEY